MLGERLNGLNPLVEGVVGVDLRGSEYSRPEVGGVPVRKLGKLEDDPYAAGLFVRDATPEFPVEYSLT